MGTAISTLLLFSLLLNHATAFQPGLGLITQHAYRISIKCFSESVDGKGNLPSLDELESRSREFLDTATGFYSPIKPDIYAEDFVFRGGVVGPLNKVDYIDTMEKLNIYGAFDLGSNAYGFVRDAEDPYSIRFFIRNTGTHVKAWKPWGKIPPIPLVPKPDLNQVRGPTEAAMLTFEPDTLRVRFFTTGNVVKFGTKVSNTSGLGAVLGLFHAIGYGFIGNLAMNSNVRAISNNLAEKYDFLGIPRTKSATAPQWWTQN